MRVCVCACVRASVCVDLYLAHDSIVRVRFCCHMSDEVIITFWLCLYTSVWFFDVRFCCFVMLYISFVTFWAFSFTCIVVAKPKIIFLYYNNVYMVTLHDIDAAN